MYCKHCGANIVEGGRFCPNCGTAAENPQQAPDYSNQQQNPNNRKNNSQLITLAIVIAMIVLVAAIAFTYMIVGEKGLFAPEATPTPMPTSTPVVTATPTQAPEVTPVVVVVERDAPENKPPIKNDGHVYNPDYLTFRNSEYGFSCAYPSNFQVYDDGGKTLYTIKNHDGSVRELISAESAGGKSVSSSMNEFISRYSGSVTYKTSGSDYYAVNINNGSSEHYKYCKFKNGNMYWFEFVYPSSQHDLYDMYINDIYSSMNIY